MLPRPRNDVCVVCVCVCAWCVFSICHIPKMNATLLAAERKICLLPLSPHAGHHLFCDWRSNEADSVVFGLHGIVKRKLNQGPQFLC